MNYTEEQFQTLAPFEGYFRTATRSGYAGYVGFRNAEKIDKIIREAGLYKSGARTNYACASCVLRILRIAGKAWFEDQEARIAAANDEQAAQATSEAASAPSTAKPDTNTKKPAKAAKTAQSAAKPAKQASPKSKTAKK